MKNTKFIKWEQNVLENLQNLKTKIDQNEQAKKLYGGFYIWDSKFIENPKIMFVGINPGNGNPNNNGSITIKPEEQMSYLEYLDGENSSDSLARETVETFELSGYSRSEIRELFNNKSIKTNLYYLITSNENDIANCLNQVENNGYDKYKVQSKNWTNDLISIMKPKVLICEGKSVFNHFKDNNIHTDYEWDNDCGSLKLNDETIVIGYSRRFSNIRNKSGLSKIINKYLPVNQVF